MAEELPHAGTCFGFAVRSELPLKFLRAGSFSTHLEVREGDNDRLADGDPLLDRQRDGRPFIRIRAVDDRLGVWFAGTGWYEVDRQRPAIRIPAAAVGPVRETRVWGLPAALCFIARGDHSVHGAAVEVDSGAIVIGAPGRFGKTTTACGFVQAGARLLSEDLSCSTLDGAPAILPGPAVLRVRHDMYEHLDLPRARAIGEDEERVFVEIEESARGDGAPVPLRAIVFLREHEGAPRIERVQPLDALPDLFALSFGFPDDTGQARRFHGASALVNAVPVFNVYRRLTFESLPDVVELIRRTCAEQIDA